MVALRYPVLLLPLPKTSANVQLNKTGMPEHKTLWLKVLLTAHLSSVMRLGRTWKSQEVLTKYGEGFGGGDKDGFEPQLSVYKSLQNGDEDCQKGEASHQDG
jgi:hypothetical protein